MSQDLQKKAKQVAFIAFVAMATSFVLASLAKRNRIAATVQNKVASGI